jgi:choline dehydrogenase-like flavoprotein
MYSINSVPQPNLNNAVTSVLIGKVVGGSSAVNGMVFFRGTSDDYDMWAELGGSGSTWNWAGVLPYFKRVSRLSLKVKE